MSDQLLFYPEILPLGTSDRVILADHTVGQVHSQDVVFNSDINLPSSNSFQVSGVAISNMISTGVASGVVPAFQDLGNGSGTVASTIINLYATTDFTGVCRRYTVPSGTLGFTEGGAEYIVVDYNNGSPYYRVESNTALMNGSNVVPIYKCWRQGTTIHSIDSDSQGVGLSNKIAIILSSTHTYNRAGNSGLIIGEITSPNPRTITVTSSYVYAGTVGVTVGAFNSSIDTFTFVGHVGGNWTYSNQLVYDNTQYDNGTSLITMSTSNKYATRWFYRSIGDVKQVFYVLGSSEYKSIDEAALETERTDLPIVIKQHCVLIGRSIIKNGATSGSVTSSFNTLYSGAQVISHNDTEAIEGGDSVTPHYYHSDQPINKNNSPTFNSVTLSGIVSTNILTSFSTTSGEIHIGSSSGTVNYSSFTSTGFLSMVGDARPWRDEVGSAVNLQQSGPGISRNNNESSVEYLTSANTADFMFANFQLNHDKDLSSSVYPHIHFWQDQNNIPNFLLQYRWQLNGGTKTTAWTNLKCNTPEFTYTTGSINQLVYASPIAPPVGTALSDILQFRIIRDSTNASTLFAGADPYTTTVSVTSFDIHFMLDTLGSRTRSSK